MTLQTLKSSLNSCSLPTHVADILWNTFGSLNAIYMAPRARLLQINGISEPIADYITNHANLFSKMSLEALCQAGDILSSPDQVRAFLRHHIGFETREQILVIFLNTENRLVDWRILFQGGPCSSQVLPGVIARESLLLNATGIVLAHNHPSGTLAPSIEDLNLTKLLFKALKLVQIRLMDHLIATSERAASIRELHPELFWEQ